MKIEKLNENQIRCTLSREDLDSRKIRLSELAYGSEKAKSLFRDLMLQASEQFGFEVNNTPLMIEAIPVSKDSIVLIVTKVEDPDELDSRFARFSPEDGMPVPKDGDLSSASLTGLDDILDLISRLSSAHLQKSGQSSAAKASRSGKSAAQSDLVQPLDIAPDPAAAAGSDAAEDNGDREDIGTDTEAISAQSEADNSAEPDEAFHITRFYMFHDLETVICASHVLENAYSGPNSLFKNQDDNHYYLILKKADTQAGVFNRVCNTLSEYAQQVEYTPGMEEFFNEHMTVLIPANALQTLQKI